MIISDAADIQAEHQLFIIVSIKIESSVCLFNDKDNIETSDQHSRENH